MKKAIIFIILFQYSVDHFGQIIADHSIVDKYIYIPQYYIDEVKKMWMVYAGESHSEAIRRGLYALEFLDERYSVSVKESGTPDLYITSNLRASRATWGDLSNTTGWIYSYGEEDWFTSSSAINRTKNGIQYCNNNNLTISAIGFGWCWDIGIDFNVYISATKEYIDFCRVNNIPTKVFFTTGTVDIFTGQNGYIKHLGYELIRDSVLNSANRILFDYADILCYDEGSGIPSTTTYDGKTYPIITSANVTPEAYGHISEVGALRLAKAMWWMLARIAGWDGVIAAIPITGISIFGAAGASTITTDNGTLQLSATIIPANASNKTVTWSIQNGTGQASISASGLVTAISNGTVTARATANDGSGVFGTITITISNQVIPVTGITVSGTSGATTITTDNGTLQLNAAVTPADATNKTVTWSIQNGTGQASISASGLVTAISNGMVTARATANDGSEVYGTLVITISNQVIPVTAISISGASGASSITSDKGTLQLSASVSPTDASNKAVTWSIQNGTGQASISASGLVTAISNGTVTARATANDGSGVFGTLTINISNQVISVTGITLSGTGGATTITTDNGTLQLNATITPADASNKTVTWSIQNGTGRASISATGLVTAIANGTVTARATVNDGSGVFGTLTITISNQVIPVTGITVSGTGDVSTISTDNGTLQLNTVVAPADATNKTVTWSIQNGTGQASISGSGLVTAIANGTVIARASANDGSDVFGTLTITISGQTVPIAGITVSGAGGVTTITSDNGTLQLSATISPADATNKTVTWSIQNGTGQASISASGLVTAIANGTVIARATANDGSGVFGTLTITISNQTIPVAGITVSGAGGASTITTDNGTLQLSASVSPTDASNKAVTWSIQNGTGQASISASGLVTAISNGTVTARATATDGSGVYGSLTITISNQVIPVSSISVSGAGGASTITSDNGTLQLTATVSPANASNKNVAWSIINGTGEATITNAGLVTAISNGTVTARATANDGSGVSDSFEITIMPTLVIIESVTVHAENLKIPIIKEKYGQIQMIADIIPENATNKNIDWSVENHTGSALINETGLLSAISNGSVKVVASTTDGSNKTGICMVAIAFSSFYSSITNYNNNINIRQNANRIIINLTEGIIEYYCIHSIYGNRITLENPCSNTIEIDISNYPPGVYLMQFSENVVPLSFKFIVN